MNLLALPLQLANEMGLNVWLWKLFWKILVKCEFWTHRLPLVFWGIVGSSNNIVLSICCRMEITSSQLLCPIISQWQPLPNPRACRSWPKRRLLLCPPSRPPWPPLACTPEMRHTSTDCTDCLDTSFIYIYIAFQGHVQEVTNGGKCNKMIWSYLDLMIIFMFCSTIFATVCPNEHHPDLSQLFT